MFPELFDLPFIHVSIKSYGLMMVIGFLLAVLLMRKMSKTAQQDPDHITNVALYALISGVLGARIFYVLHHYSQFKGDFASVFAVWQGGLEFLGGVILAVVIVFTYLLFNKLPMRMYFDLLGVGLMVGLAFGRIGCLMNGCCFGGPSDIPCAITFPYGSPPYQTQVKPDPSRNRTEPYLDLPAEYFGFLDIDGKTWHPADEQIKYQTYLKPYELLTEEQKQQVKEKYHALPIHPTQIYAFFNALILCAILYTFWRKFGIKHPGCTISLMFMLYGPTRFVLEAIRDDNPFEHAWWAIHDGWTVSQNLGVYLAIGATVMFAICAVKKTPLPQPKP
jgi:phosphatidylglycerol:prolipoprotein diacylglycerol transferase